MSKLVHKSFSPPSKKETKKKKEKKEEQEQTECLFSLYYSKTLTHTLMYKSLTLQITNSTSKELISHMFCMLRSFLSKKCDGNKNNIF